MQHALLFLRRMTFAFLVLGVAGCGSSSDQMATSSVKGTVTYDGKPVSTGTVMFTPTGGGPPATGQIQPDGTYELKTYEEGDGAVLGEHKVTIIALDMGSGLPEDTAAEPKALIPDKYGRDTTSGLTATVTDGENTIDFPLV